MGDESLQDLRNLIDWNLANTGDVCRFVFRGVKDSRYLLIPKVSRTHNSFDAIDKETACSRLDRLRSYLTVYLPAYGLNLHNLAGNEKLWTEMFVAQHYGAPTNLLDFTRNPLVPAFFACENDEKDGTVYAFRVEEYREGANSSNTLSKG